MKSIYAANHLKFFDKIVVFKRLEMSKIINSYLKNKKISSVLDIGTTEDTENESSNLIIKNIKNIKIFNSISDQKINSNLFTNILQKSITTNFSEDEIKKMSSDLCISNATIEHVGSHKNQIKMIKNMMDLSNKILIILTPNRFHPLDFHTKLPFIHWLPKSLHRKILKYLSLDYFSREENLNLLSINDLKKILKNFEPKIRYKIKTLNLFGFKSNIIVFIEKI